jgi:hypothetical protein
MERGDGEVMERGGGEGRWRGVMERGDGEGRWRGVVETGGGEGRWRGEMEVMERWWREGGSYRALPRLLTALITPTNGSTIDDTDCTYSLLHPTAPHLLVFAVISPASVCSE